MTTPKSSRSDFYHDVYEVVKLIPRGRVTTYGAIAKYLGANKSSRVVGYALNLGVNDVPAHRVVNRLGMLSGRHHFPADDPMEARLAAEDIVVIDNRVQNFETLFWDPKVELL